MFGYRNIWEIKECEKDEVHVSLLEKIVNLFTSYNKIMLCIYILGFLQLGFESSDYFWGFLPTNLSSVPPIITFCLSENCVADVDICFVIFFYFFITDVDSYFRNMCCGCRHLFRILFFVFLYYGCRCPLQKIVLRMSTSVS